MELRIEHITNELGGHRAALLGHPVYSSIGDLESLRRFTECHVFAVWDFMSLLKSLQRSLTCVSIPWRPVGDAETGFLINEIVLGEESDVDGNGVRTSHFELYLEAMRRLGASTERIDGLVAACGAGSDVREAVSNLGVDLRIRDFLDYTFDVCFDAPTHVQAAVFTFGREELIPNMFMKILDGLFGEHPEHVGTFRYYIERHIEVDGGHHNKLALEMVSRLCGDDDVKWREALAACTSALDRRHGLWSAAFDAIASGRTANSPLCSAASR
jgi:hypothetical protein